MGLFHTHQWIQVVDTSYSEKENSKPIGIMVICNECLAVRKVRLTGDIPEIYYPDKKEVKVDG